MAVEKIGGTQVLPPGAVPSLLDAARAVIRCPNHIETLEMLCAAIKALGHEQDEDLHVK